MLAKNANDNADILGNRAVRKLFASKLAPTAGSAHSQPRHKEHLSDQHPYQAGYTPMNVRNWIRPCQKLPSPQPH
ncbi:hypothetical protein DXU77_01385 [Pseudomonas lactis]|nr:hypothetical protein [Pseudomonas lactis]